MSIDSFHGTAHQPKRPNELLDLRQKHGIPSEEARQEALLEAEDAAPSAEVWRSLQNSDEMSSAMAMFYNRRDYDKKVKNFSSSFERVLDEDAVPKSKQIIKALKSGSANIDELLRHARSLFPDDSDLVLVLRELLSRTQLKEMERKRLQELLEQVEQQADPKSLKAGINSALKAQLFGNILALSAGLLRASYRQFLQSEDSLVEVYIDWIASYGHEARDSVLDFMEEALLADISAQDPSCSHIEFGNFLGRLGQLKLLRSADLNFVKTIIHDNQVKSFNPNEKDWLILMLSLLQGYEVDALLVDTVGKNALFSQHKAHSVLLHSLYRACKEIPLSLFLEEKWKDDLLEALREMSTIAYRHELTEQRCDTDNSLPSGVNKGA